VLNELQQIILFASLGSLSYGYGVGIISTTLGQPSFIKYFGFDWRPNTPQLQGAISGLFQAGAFIGALLCQPAADKLGRRKALLIDAIVSVIAGALQAGSVHVGMLIVMRFIAGLALGIQ
jgi:MFS family permease